MKKVRDKSPDEGAPDVLDMHDHDAKHAVAADPERYEIIPPSQAEVRAQQRSRMTLDQRVAALEAAYDALTAEPDDEPDSPPAPAKPEKGLD